MIHYGKKLKNYRVLEGTSQEAFALKMNRSQNAVSSIERNAHPTLENIILYLDTLKKPPRLYEFFMEDEDIKEITGVDPSWITIAQMVEQMPEEIKTKIMANILQIVEMMLETVEKWKVNMEKNLHDRNPL